MTARDPSKHSIFVCQWCGKEFENWTYRKSTFCSNQCRSEYAARQPKPSQRRPENFVDRICERCGKVFRVHKCHIARPGRHANYCSKECQSIVVGLGMRGKNNVNFTNGKSDARGPNWGGQKRRALKRDNKTCQKCGKTGNTRNLDVHHKTPYKLFNGDFEKANQLSNLITLCHQCHADVEPRSKRVKKSL